MNKLWLKLIPLFLWLPPALPAAAPIPSAGTALAYPSPASGGFIHFVYDMPGPGQALIRVYNEAGDLAAQVQENKGSGIQESLMNVAYYSPGIYFFRVLLFPDSGGQVKLKLGKFSVVR